MATICIAGVAPGIGKTAVAEMLLANLDGWHAVRVRVADEIPDVHAPHLAEAGFALLRYPDETGPDAELARLAQAGAVEVRTLMAEPRGLAAGIDTLARAIPVGRHLLLEGNAYLWGADADVAVMVLGPGPTGKGLVRVRPSVRELFGKIDVWVWSTRTEPAAEGFFEFPQALARMGFARAVTNAADFHHVSPGRPDDAGREAFLEALRRRLEAAWVRHGSDAFLRRIGFRR